MDEQTREKRSCEEDRNEDKGKGQDGELTLASREHCQGYFPFIPIQAVFILSVRVFKMDR